MTLPRAAPAALVERLEALLHERPEPSALAFDGDGTLWSGDVGQDVFDVAVAGQRLQPEATAALRDMAGRFDVRVAGDSPSDLAQQLFRGYQAGHVPELEICEAMTWAYAGFSRSELYQLIDAALDEAQLGSRLQRELAPVLDWARRRGVRCVVVSASPQEIVERAARRWGIEASDVRGARARFHGEVAAPELAAPVPYGEQKALQGRELLGGTRWLASFGDSGFDADMMLSADLGVAVRPKPSLLERLREVPASIELCSV